MKCFFVFLGGTNFGYMNGAGMSNEPVTTSYDYDAPLNEAGDPTPKYFAIREKIQNLTGQEITTPVPPATPKAKYGSVPADFLGEVTILLQALAPPEVRILSEYPKTFEQIGFPYGFVLYETVMPFDVKTNVNVQGVNDRGYVMVDGVVHGLVTIIGRKYSVPAQIKKKSKLQILVENNGRQCSGYNDPKGILGNVTADDRVLTNWTIYPISLENIFHQLKHSHKRQYLAKKARLGKLSDPTKTFAPSIYYAKFPASDVADTYFDPTNWGKGQLFMNEQNVGRYWPSLGPQVTLYVPKTMVKGLNYVVILELESPGNCHSTYNFTCDISFTDVPILNKTVHGLSKIMTKNGRNPSRYEISV